MAALPKTQAIMRLGRACGRGLEAALRGAMRAPRSAHPRTDASLVTTDALALAPAQRRAMRSAASASAEEPQPPPPPSSQPFAKDA